MPTIGHEYGEGPGSDRESSRSVCFLKFPGLQQVQEVCFAQISLLENPFQQGRLDVAGVMNRDRHPESLPCRVEQSSVTTPLVMDIESCALKRSQQLSWFYRS